MPEPIRLCSLEDLEPTGARGIELPGENHGEFVIIRDKTAPCGVRAYENSCPHQRAPLETFPDRFLDRTRRFLICTMHGARFRIEDGYCIAGPCKGKSLSSIKTSVRNGEVFLERE